MNMNTSPVTLAPGSYDYDALKSGLGAAARGAKSKYADNVAAAIEEAGEFVHKDQDPRAIPGFKFAAVKNDLGGVEQIQVFDVDAAAKLEAEGGDGISEADLQNRQAETRAAAVAAADSPKE